MERKPNKAMNRSRGAMRIESRKSTAATRQSLTLGLRRSLEKTVKASVVMAFVLAGTVIGSELASAAAAIRGEVIVHRRSADWLSQQTQEPWPSRNRSGAPTRRSQAQGGF